MKIAKALFNYTAATSDELSFQENDILLLVGADSDPGWLTGLLIFQNDTLAVCMDSIPASATSLPPPLLIPRSYVEELVSEDHVAAFDYSSQGDGEISLMERQPVCVYRATEDGWSIVLAQSGQLGFCFGFVPSNYLEPSQHSFPLFVSTSPSLSNNESFADNGASPQYVDPLKAYAQQHSTNSLVEADLDANEFDDDLDPSAMAAGGSISPKKEIIDMASLAHNVAVSAAFKIGKKSKTKDGYIASSFGQLYFLMDQSKKERNLSTKRILFQWPVSSLTKTAREKKTLVLEFGGGSDEFRFTFKNKPDLFHFVEGFGGVIEGSEMSSGGSMDARLPVKPFVSAAHPSPLAITMLPSPRSPATSPKPTRFAKVLYDYKAQNEEEVDIFENETCDVLENEDEGGWIKVGVHRFNKVYTGFVPLSYIELVDHKSPAIRSPSPVSVSTAPPPKPTRSRVTSPTSATGMVPIKPPRPTASLSSTTAMSSAHNTQSHADSPPPKPLRPNADAKATSPPRDHTSITSPPKPYLPPRLPARDSVSDLPPAVKSPEQPPKLPTRAESFFNSEPIAKSPQLAPRPATVNTQPMALSSSSVSTPIAAESSPKSAKTPAVKRESRIWTDKSGSFKVEASFVALSDGKIVLLKTNGVKIGVAKEKMSSADLEYLDEIGVAVGSLPMSPVKPQESKSQTLPRDAFSKKKETDYDWKSFFLDAGVPEEDAQTYAEKFDKEKMGADTLGFLSREILRDFGVAQGHAIRIMAHSSKVNGAAAPAAASSATLKPALSKNSSSFGNFAADSNVSAGFGNFVDSTSKPGSFGNFGGASSKASSAFTTFGDLGDSSTNAAKEPSQSVSAETKKAEDNNRGFSFPASDRSESQRDVMTPLQPKKQADVASGSVSSLFSDPEVKAKLLAAEQEARRKSMAILSNSKKPSSIQESSFQAAIPSSSLFKTDFDIMDERASQEKNDEALARELQDMELRNAGLRPADSGNSKPAVSAAARPVAAAAPAFNAPPLKQEPSFDWASGPAPKRDSIDTKSANSIGMSLNGSSVSSNNNTIRRGRVAAGNNVDADVLFSAAKSLNAAPAVSERLNTPASTPMLTQNFSSNSMVMTAAPVVPSFNSNPLVPMQAASYNPANIRVDSGDLPVQISVKVQQQDSFNQSMQQPQRQASQFGPSSFQATPTPMQPSFQPVQASILPPQVNALAPSNSWSAAVTQPASSFPTQPMSNGPSVGISMTNPNLQQQQQMPRQMSGVGFPGQPQQTMQTVPPQQVQQQLNPMPMQNGQMAPNLQNQLRMNTPMQPQAQGFPQQQQMQQQTQPRGFQPQQQQGFQQQQQPLRQGLQQQLPQQLPLQQPQFSQESQQFPAQQQFQPQQQGFQQGAQRQQSQGFQQQFNGPSIPQQQQQSQQNLMQPQMMKQGSMGPQQMQGQMMPQMQGMPNMQMGGFPLQPQFPNMPNMLGANGQPQMMMGNMMMPPMLQGMPQQAPQEPQPDKYAVFRDASATNPGMFQPQQLQQQQQNYGWPQ